MKQAICILKDTNPEINEFDECCDCKRYSPLEFHELTPKTQWQYMPAPNADGSCPSFVEAAK